MCIVHSHTLTHMCNPIFHAESQHKADVVLSRFEEMQAEREEQEAAWTSALATERAQAAALQNELVQSREQVCACARARLCV